METILTNTEEANRDALTALNAARAAVRNTNSILTGDARTVMIGDDYLPFPTGEHSEKRLGSSEFYTNNLMYYLLSLRSFASAKH